MNRLLLPLLFTGLMSLTGMASACNWCGNASCCTPTQTCCRTTYKVVAQCRPVIKYRRVVCRDACGRCYTKCVPYTAMVRTYCRVPVTTCYQVPAPCCAPVARCCNPCASAPRLVARPSFLARLQSLKASRYCCL